MTKTIADLSPEQRFIVDAVRLAFGRPLPDAGGLPYRPSLDWDSLLAQVSKQGLAPLVYSGLKRSRVTVPVEVQSRLRMGFLGAVLRLESGLNPTLRLILQQLELAGVKPIVLKGAALAHTVYPEPAFRTMSDVDLLVAEDEIDRAREALDGLDSVAVGGVEKDHHHLNPRLVKDRAVWVEIHHHLIPEENPYALNLRDVRDRSLAADLAGVKARVLAPTDSLHFVCLHLSYGHRYGWHPLRSLIDILAMTSAGEPTLDWDLFLRTTRQSRTAGAVYWPLLLASEWLGAPVPESVLSSLAPVAAVRSLVSAAMDPRYLLEDQTPEERGNEVLYNVLLSLSLVTGCPAGRQVAATLRAVFPTPKGVGHLPPEVTGSRWRFGAYLARPDRAVRGILAFVRLLKRSQGRVHEQIAPSPKEYVVMPAKAGIQRTQPEPGFPPARE